MTEYIQFGGKCLRQFVWKQCEHLHRAIQLVWRCTPPGVHSEFLPSSSQFQNVIFLIHTHKGLITEVQQSTLLLLCICSTGNYKRGFWVLKASLSNSLFDCLHPTTAYVPKSKIIWGLHLFLFFTFMSNFNRQCCTHRSHFGGFWITVEEEQKKAIYTYTKKKLCINNGYSKRN